MPHEHGRMQYWDEVTQGLARGLRRLKPRPSDWAQPAPPVSFIDHAAIQEIARQQQELRKAASKHQAMSRARQIEKEKRAAARKLHRELLKANTAEGKLYVLMQRDAHEQTERKFREHVRSNAPDDDNNHCFTVWHHSGRPEVWLDGRATCTAGDMVEEFEQMLYGDNETPLFTGVRPA